MGGVIAFILLFVQAVTLVQYLYATWCMIVLEQAERPKVQRWSSSMSVDRLQYRMSYNTKRFSSHAQ